MDEEKKKTQSSFTQEKLKKKKNENEIKKITINENKEQIENANSNEKQNDIQSANRSNINNENALPSYYHKSLKIIRAIENENDEDIRKIKELTNLGINVHHTAKSYALAFKNETNKTRNDIILPQNLFTRNLQRSEHNEFENKTRAEYIFDKLSKEHCEPDDIEMIRLITEQFADQFYVLGDTLSKSHIIQHRIPIKAGSTPKYVRQFRIPEMQKENMKKSWKDRVL